MAAPGRGFVSSGFLNLTPREAFIEASENDSIFLDVREKILIGYKCFDVPKIIYLPKSRLEEDWESLPRDELLIIADTVGLHSHEAMEFLLSKGFTNIANLAGGIVDWEHDGLPLKIDKSEQMDGSCVCQLRPRHKKKE
jgi:rhodanese-related sulfurtransferase